MVYSATYHNYPVACKVLKKPVESRRELYELDELKIMKLLRHPNVVLLMGYGINPERQIVLLTEYAELGSLKEVLPDIMDIYTRLKVFQQ